jgi:hypothetical protein
MAYWYRSHITITLKRPPGTTREPVMKNAMKVKLMSRDRK